MANLAKSKNQFFFLTQLKSIPFHNSLVYTRILFINILYYRFTKTMNKKIKTFFKKIFSTSFNLILIYITACLVCCQVTKLELSNFEFNVMIPKVFFLGCITNSKVNIHFTTEVFFPEDYTKIHDI